MSEWHINGDLWRAYAAGRLTPDADAAVEAHVTTCSVCRDGAREVVGDPESVWEAVHARIDHPRRRLSWLRRLGMRDDDLVVVAASDDLRSPWALAVGAAIANAVAAAQLPFESAHIFLFLAPLTPLLAVAAAFDATDPLRELTNTAPYPRLRLTLLRSLATLAVAVPAVIGLGCLVPGLGATLWFWLLPGLALTAAMLVLLTWWSAAVAACAAGAAWIGGLTFVTSAGRADVVASAAGQWLCVAVVVALAAGLTALSSHPQAIGGSR